MLHFEIHGDEHRMTVRANGIVFEVWRWQLGEYDPLNKSTRLVLDIVPSLEELDATPTIYGDGVWLH